MNFILQSQERIRQIKEKMSRKQQLSSEESMIMVEWKKQLDRAQEIEDEKNAKQYRADMDANAHIKDQVITFIFFFSQLIVIY